jgi:hypothetical protein
MSAIGLKQIVLCDRGRLRNNPQFLVAMGMGDEAGFERTEVPVKGNNDEEYEDKVEHKYSYKSFQFTSQILAYLLYFAQQGGADLQVVGQKVATGVWTGCYDYTGDNFMGIDWELTQSMKDRSLLITPAVALEASVDRQIMQSANSVVPLDLNALALGHLGVNPSIYVAPGKQVISNYTGFALCNEWEVIDRVYKIKTIGIKRYRDRTKVTFINFNFSITIDQVNAWQVITYLANPRNNGLYVTETLPTGGVFTFDFGSNLFQKKTDFLNKKSEGNIKLTFNRNISLGDIVVDVNNNKLTVAATV